jgi:hypothetical protein
LADLSAGEEAEKEKRLNEAATKEPPIANQSLPFTASSRNKAHPPSLLPPIEKTLVVALKDHMMANTLESGSNALKMHNEDSEALEERLFTATFVTRCGGLYFIVDCWHHRILYSNRWSFNLSDFASIDRLGGPHSVACNNRIVMMEDTGYNKVRAYSLDNLKSDLQNRKETIEYTEFNTTSRPHRTAYDEKTAAFYVMTANNDFYKFTDSGNNITQVIKKELRKMGPECGYSRSFTITNEELLVCCSTGKIKRYTFEQGDYQYIGAYPAPKNLNDVYHSSSGWWYVTSTFDGFWRVRSLDDLAVNGTVIGSQARKLGFRGVPYYVSEVDGVLIVPQIASPRAKDESAIVTFRESSDPTEALQDKLVILDAGRPKEVDVKRKKGFST